jgi:hypothetical protein
MLTPIMNINLKHQIEELVMIALAVGTSRAN